MGIKDWVVFEKTVGAKLNIFTFVVLEEKTKMRYFKVFTLKCQNHILSLGEIELEF